VLDVLYSASIVNNSSISGIGRTLGMMTKTGSLTPSAADEKAAERRVFSLPVVFALILLVPLTS